MLRHLPLSGGSRWLDVCSGGGYLSHRACAQGLPPARFACDGSFPFLRSSGREESVCVAGPQGLPFPDGSFDGAACLAALHHAEDPGSVCRELLRVVGPGGRTALGDVARGSPASHLLNGFVDRHTQTGHRGRFYALEEIAGFFRRAGGREIRGERLEIPWFLPSRQDAVEFCRSLFGLEPSASGAQIERALDDLGARSSGGKFRIPWTMHYVSAGRD